VRTFGRVLDPDEVEDPRRWYSTNLVGIPSQLLAAVDFNAFPRQMSIAGTRAQHGGLFSLLEKAGDRNEAAEIFEHYMELAFGVRARRDSDLPPAQRYWKSSYLRLLQGYGFDANGPPGAVLKGWIESRFGIAPTFHKAPLEEFPSESWMRYLEEKLNSRYHNNCIQLQLDVLYEYCQWSLARFSPFDGAYAPLYRGIDRAEACFLKGSLAERHGVLRMNNVVSLSIARELAEPFGSLMVALRVPLSKILFFPGLLRDRVLNGEGEVLAIGGDFEVEVSYA